MGIFTRRPRNGAVATANSPRTRRRRGLEPYTMSTRPSFGQWLKATWLDIITMIVLGAIGLGVYFAKPAPTRSFPVTFSDGEVVWPSVAYPLRKEIVPIWAAAMLAALVPIVVILFCQIRVRSFWDVNNAVIGLLYSLITAAVFQVFIKWLIGGLRPHFLDVCKPDLSLLSNAPGAFGAGLNGKGFNGLYYTREICTGDERRINDALESMPSGHSTAAFAGFVFLSLYLNGKLKVFSNYHPAMWKLAAVYAPVLGAVLIAGALTIDEFHHFHDILAGGIIGTVMAFSAYRMTYASVWDWRYNHIPLNRTVPFDFMAGHELSGATFTRAAAWGPGDRHGKTSGDSYGRKSWNGHRKEVAAHGGNGTGVPVAHTRGDEMV